MILCHPERSPLKNQNIYSKNRLYNHNHQNPDIFRGCFRPLVHGSAVKADKRLAAGRAIRSLKITLGTFSSSCPMKSVIYDLSIYVHKISRYIKYIFNGSFPSTTTGCKQRRLPWVVFVPRTQLFGFPSTEWGVEKGQVEQLFDFEVWIPNFYDLLIFVASPPHRKMANKCVCVCVGVTTDDIP